VDIGVEYSIGNLKKIELEPLTVDDYELIEENTEFIENEILNQIGIFYNDLVFPTVIHFNKIASLRAKIEIDEANCYYLDPDCEILVKPLRRQKRQPEEPIKVPDKRQIEEDILEEKVIGNNVREHNDSTLESINFNSINSASGVNMANGFRFRVTNAGS
jgi:hypothetical protein